MLMAACFSVASGYHYIFLLNFLSYLFLYYVCECFVSVYTCEGYACSTLRGQKRVLDPLELELPLLATIWAIGINP